MKRNIAENKWNQIPENIKKIFLSNVICLNCGMTTITDYVVRSAEQDIVLRGKCKKCGHKVARLIEYE